jgi:hypothetical protein
MFHFILFYFYFKNPGGGNGEKDFLQTSFLSFIDAKTFELICTTRRGEKKKGNKRDLKLVVINHYVVAFMNQHFACRF